jgi:hypothetical protein
MVVAPVVKIHFPALDPCFFAIKESFMEAVYGVIMSAGGKDRELSLSDCTANTTGSEVNCVSALKETIREI